MKAQMNKKYDKNKIKQEHHILPEFQGILQEIAQISQVKRIIPGRISRKQKWSSHNMFTFSYFTPTWLKYNMKKGATAQEVFITCDEQYKNIVKKSIHNIKIKNNIETN